MPIWRRAQDREVMSRLQEEALHKAALESFERGERRKGLWAKALIESGGDVGRANAVYLRLLVVALKDELYLASRMNDVIARNNHSSFPDTFPVPPSEKPVQDLSYIAKAAARALESNDDFEVCRELIAHAGGTIDSKGFIFNMHYIVQIDGEPLRLDNYQALSDWVRANLPLEKWASRG